MGKHVEFTAKEAGVTKLVLPWLLCGSGTSPVTLPQSSEPSPARRTLQVISSMSSEGTWILDYKACCNRYCLSSFLADVWPCHLHT